MPLKLNKTLTYGLIIAGLLMAMGCSGNKKAIVQHVQEEKRLVADLPDSSAAKRNYMTTELDGSVLKKTVSYPYLNIRFKQNDTEVEMVLDPLQTNLSLELKRGGAGEVEIMHGDSLLTGDPRPESADSLDTQLDAEDFRFADENLTDDIIRDINLAQKLFYQRKYEQALQVLNESLQKQETASAFALGGSIYFVNGEVDEAVRAWENALQINPQLDEIRQLVLRFKKDAARTAE